MKNWKPKKDEQVWYIHNDYGPLDQSWCHYDKVSCVYLEELGLYKTRKEAQTMIKKIKAFVKKELNK
jgi:hypothetical protein